MNGQMDGRNEGREGGKRMKEGKRIERWMEERRMDEWMDRWYKNGSRAIWCRGESS
jgi:hypothetical protein